MAQIINKRTFLIISDILTCLPTLSYYYSRILHDIPKYDLMKRPNDRNLKTLRALNWSKHHCKSCNKLQKSNNANFIDDSDIPSKTMGVDNFTKSVLNRKPNGKRSFKNDTQSWKQEENLERFLKKRSLEDCNKLDKFKKTKRELDEQWTKPVRKSLPSNQYNRTRDSRVELDKSYNRRSAPYDNLDIWRAEANWTNRYKRPTPSVHSDLRASKSEAFFNDSNDDAYNRRNRYRRYPPPSAHNEVNHYRLQRYKKYSPNFSYLHDWSTKSNSLISYGKQNTRNVQLNNIHVPSRDLKNWRDKAERNLSSSSRLRSLDGNEIIPWRSLLAAERQNSVEDYCFCSKIETEESSQYQCQCKFTRKYSDSV